MKRTRPAVTRSHARDPLAESESSDDEAETLGERGKRVRREVRQRAATVASHTADENHDLAQ
jgi:hypothetical protein